MVPLAACSGILEGLIPNLSSAIESTPEEVWSSIFNLFYALGADIARLIEFIL